MTPGENEQAIEDLASQTTPGIEHNHYTFRRELDEAGFSRVVSSAVSAFTIILHTRTLNDAQLAEFEAWIADQESIDPIGDDPDGAIYRVTL